MPPSGVEIVNSVLLRFAIRFSRFIMASVDCMFQSFWFFSVAWLALVRVPGWSVRGECMCWQKHTERAPRMQTGVKQRGHVHGHPRPRPRQPRAPKGMVTKGRSMRSTKGLQRQTERALAIPDQGRSRQQCRVTGRCNR